MIALIDYGMGNLASVYNAFKNQGYNDVIITASPEDIEKADKLVLPGVGAFEDAMKNLSLGGLIDPIKNSVKAGKPFLGICLGFQLIFEKSHEGGEFEGLGILKGSVERFDVEMPVPHMGWNEAEFTRKGQIFDQFDKNVYFYFDHAYYPIGVESDVVAAQTVYSGVKFTSAVWKDNVYGTQFHPEKSHDNGLKIVRRFIEIQ